MGMKQNLLIVLLGFVHQVCSYTVNDANNLHTALFTGYKNLVLPDSPVTIQAEYNLLSIKEVEMKSQILTTSGWFTVVWVDSRLSWNKASYGNIEHIYVSQTSIWHPQLVVENSITDLSNLWEDNTQIRIQFDGELRWEPPAILSTACDMGVGYFPYDSQTCAIELASWGFHTDSVNLTFYKSNINLENYHKNGEWDLTSTSQVLDELQDDNLAYAELKFQITLERMPGHYIMSVIIPVIITAVLTSVTFLLPVESGEKVGYILTVLLALAVLLTLFADSMPTTSKHTSILVVFLTVTLALAACAIILTVLIIKLYHRKEDENIPEVYHKLACKWKKFTSKVTCGQGKEGQVKRVKGKDTDTSAGSKVMDKENGTGVHNKDNTAWNETNEENVQAYETHSNKELSRIFDSLCFVVFTVLYFFVCLLFIVALSSKW